jgi:hypothetical protein
MWRRSLSVGFRGHLSDIDKTGICAIYSMSYSVFLLSSLYMGDSRETAYRPRRKPKDSPHRLYFLSPCVSAKEVAKSRGMVWLPKPRKYGRDGS